MTSTRQWPAVHNQNENKVSVKNQYKQRFLNETFKTRKKNNTSEVQTFPRVLESFRMKLWMDGWRDKQIKGKGRYREVIHYTYTQA